MSKVFRPEGSYSGYKKRILVIKNGQESIGFTVLTNNKFAKQDNLLLLHGSGGVGADIDLWTRAACSRNYRVIIIDHFSGRGIEKLKYDGSDQRIISFLDQCEDVRLLKNQYPEIFDGVSTSIVGFSMGGSAAMVLNSAEYRQVFSLYPCVLPFMGEFQNVYSEGLVAYFGRDDSWTPATYLELLNDRRDGEKKINFKVFENCSHSFMRPHTSASFEIVDLLGAGKQIEAIVNHEEFLKHFANPQQFSEYSELKKEIKIEFNANASEQVLKDFFGEPIAISDFFQLGG